MVFSTDEVRAMGEESTTRLTYLRCVHSPQVAMLKLHAVSAPITVVQLVTAAKLTP